MPIAKLPQREQLSIDCMEHEVQVMMPKDITSFVELVVGGWREGGLPTARFVHYIICLSDPVLFADLMCVF